MSVISVRTADVRPDSVRFGAEHVLFVEGREGSLDARVLSVLFDDRIRVQPLGPSFSIKSVAEALFPHHPTYYFLIDRDHFDDAYVDRCWNDFPDPRTHNLLVWRRREIENYFIEPSFLATSKYLRSGTTKDVLTQCIVQSAQQRLFLDVANRVVVHIREELKTKWVETFSNPADFGTKGQALERLRAVKAFTDRKKKLSQLVSTRNIGTLFGNYLDRMTGGQEKLAVGVGEWLSHIQGKAVLHQIVHSNVFVVPDAKGVPVNGGEKLNAVVKGLLCDETHLPDDFKTLKRLILARGLV